MKMNTLTKAISAVAIASIATTSMAAESVTEKTGDKLVSITDTVYSTLTGKQVQNVTVNHPVSLYDYSQASSEYQSSYLSGSLNVNDKKDAEYTYNANVGVDYDRVISSADANTTLKAELNGFASGSGEKNAKNEETYNGKASATYDRYFDPQNSDAFWFGNGQIRIQEEGPKDYAGIKNPEVKVGGGLGYGRVVNVTSMARAMRLVEALVENGSISKTPSAAAYNKIAQIIDTKDAYKDEHAGKYAQYWVKDIAQALGANLDAGGVIRAYEALENESISTRKYGWEVRGGVGVVANNFAGKSGNPFVELQGNYYYPISNKTQFSNEAKVGFELDDKDNSYVLTNDMGLTYELSDRVDWENKWNLTYQDNENKADVLRNTLSSAFLYEINNSLDYETRLNLSHVDVDGKETQFDKGLFMGVKYRLK